MSFVKIVVAAAVPVLSASMYAQMQSAGAGDVPPMRQLYVQDQRDRGVLLSDTGDALPANSMAKPAPASDEATLEKRDAERRQRVRELLSVGKVTTAQDFHDAAFIFQHGQEPADYLLAHILAVEAVIKGDASSKWISAATLDRYLQSIGQAQIFGTQYLDKNYSFILQHRHDPAAIKTHQPESGSTLQPYDDKLMPDALRLDFCVPNRVQQDLNLKEFNAGRYPERIVPPGCTR